MINSLRKNGKGIILMVLSSLFVCIGQLFWKLSLGSNIIYLLIGFILYGCGALIMIYAYRFGKLSVLQPVLSINYVFTLLLGYFVLHEAMSLLKFSGIIIIIIGVILIGGDTSDIS